MEFAGRGVLELTAPVRSSLDAKEQVRQAIDIVDLVGGVIQLRRQGRNYVGLCPWHDDSHPSFQVNPERQSFKCWVCDIGGDVFSFVMKMEGVEFPEALAMLADRAGITLEKPHREAHEGEPAEPAPTDKRTLYKAMAWAEGQYHQCLLESPRGRAGEKISSRPRHLGGEHRAIPPRLFARGSRLDPQASRRQPGEGKDAGGDWPVGPAGRRRGPLRPFPGPRAVLDSRRPGPSGGNGRAGAPGAFRQQPGKIRQFARNAAVRQESAPLRAGRRQGGDPQERGRHGHGGLHRLHRRPPIRLRQRRRCIRHRTWARPISAY